MGSFMSFRRWVLGFVFLTSLSGCEVFPDLTILKSQYPVVIFVGRKEPPRIRFQKGRPEDWVPIDQISKAALGAVVVSEDWAFYTHQGIDTNQLREAIQKDLEEGRFARGASTITQQVVKNVFLERDKTIWRKIREAYLAVKLEKVIPKRKILEVYFNIAEWGDGIYGIGPAARHYFNKQPSELTAKEGAFLAALLPSPIRYGQSFRSRQLTSFMRRQIGSILTKMVQARYLSAEERVSQLGVSLSFEKDRVSVPSTFETPSGLSFDAPSDEETLTDPESAGDNR